MMLYVLVAGGRGVIVQAARLSPNSRVRMATKFFRDETWDGRIVWNLCVTEYQWLSIFSLQTGFCLIHVLISR
jgi:hypothetical protein